MSAATFIHDHLHLGHAGASRADEPPAREESASRARPDLMITVIVSMLAIVLAIGLLRLAGWYGTGAVFLLTLIACGALARMIRHMVEDGDRAGSGRHRSAR